MIDRRRMSNAEANGGEEQRDRRRPGELHDLSTPPEYEVEGKNRDHDAQTLLHACLRESERGRPQAARTRRGGGLLFAVERLLREDVAPVAVGRERPLCVFSQWVAEEA